MDNIIWDITLKVENLKKEIEGNKKKYYHFRSVSNFLFYTEMLNNKEDKAFVVEKLNGFTTYIENNRIDNVHDSLAMFKEYLKPIGEFYEKEFGFFVMIKPWILNIWIILFLIVFWVLQNRFYFIIFLIPVTLFCFYLAVKVYKKKVYAFMW